LLKCLRGQAKCCRRRAAPVPYYGAPLRVYQLDPILHYHDAARRRARRPEKSRHNARASDPAPKFGEAHIGYAAADGHLTSDSNVRPRAASGIRLTARIKSSNESLGTIDRTF
jgi:hypothetical protein